MNTFFIKNEKAIEFALNFGSVTKGNRRIVFSLNGYQPDEYEGGFLLKTTLTKRELRDNGLLVSHNTFYV